MGVSIRGAGAGEVAVMPSEPLNVVGASAALIVSTFFAIEKLLL